MSKILTILIAAALVSPTFAETAAQQAEAFYKQGQNSEKAGDPAAAKESYTSALRLNPGHANARYSLGQLKINAGTLAAKGREAKFGTVTVPVFQLDGATLQEALDALSQIIAKQSKEAAAPNFVIEDPKGQLAAQKITLNLKNMPAKA